MTHRSVTHPIFSIVRTSHAAALPGALPNPPPPALKPPVPKAQRHRRRVVPMGTGHFGIYVPQTHTALRRRKRPELRVRAWARPFWGNLPPIRVVPATYWYRCSASRNAGEMARRPFPRVHAGDAAGSPRVQPLAPAAPGDRLGGRLPDGGGGRWVFRSRRRVYLDH